MLIIPTKKRQYFALVALFLFLMTLFIEPLLERIYIRHSIQHYVKKHLKGVLTFDSLDFSGQQWVFSKPKIVSELGLDFHAEEIVIDYAFSFFNWTLDVKVGLIHPVIHYDIQQNSSKKGIPLYKNHSNLISYNHFFYIRDGVFKRDHECFCFDYEMFSKGKSIDFAKLNFDKHEENYSVLEGNQRQNCYDLKFSNVDCQKVLGLIKIFYPSLGNIELEEGKINGTLSLKSENLLLIKNSDIVLTNLKGKYQSLEGRFANIGLFLEEQAQNKKGKLSLEGPFCLQAYQKKMEVWQIDGIGGVVNFFQNKFEGEFRGVLKADQWSKPITLSTFGDLNTLIPFQFQTTLEFTPPTNSSKIHFVHHFNPSKYLLNIFTQSFPGLEANIFLGILSNYFPVTNSFAFNKGSISFNTEFIWQKNSLQSCKLDKLQFTETDLQLAQAHLKTHSLLLQNVHFEVDQFKQTLEGNLIYSDLNVKVNNENFAPILYEKGSGDIKVKKGEFIYSQLDGIINGLKTSLKLEPNRTYLFDLNVEGELKQFAELAEKKGKTYLAQELLEKNVLLHLQAQEGSHQCILEGILKVENNRSSTKLPLKILLKKFLVDQNKPLDKRGLSKFNWDTNPSLQDVIAWFWKIEDWQCLFEGKSLSAKELIAPLIFDDKSIGMEGLIDVSGSFNHKGLDIYYSGSEISLTSKNFQIDLKNLSNNDHQIASHYFDFETGHHRGTLFVQEGTYFEKNSGLLFTELDTQVNINNKTLSFPVLEAFSNGLFFSGSADLDLSNPLKGYFNLLINLQIINGKFSELKSFLAHFKKSFNDFAFPLEGEISLKDLSQIHFLFKPEDYEVRTSIYGELSEGKIDYGNPHVKIQDISLDINYFHDRQYLDFTDIQGTVLLGKNKWIEEYILAGDYLRFNDLHNLVGEFDFWIGDKNRDILRLAGNSFLKEELINIRLNQNISHFSSIYPTWFNLSFHPDKNIEDLEIKINFDLYSLLPDIQKLAKVGLFPKLASTICKKLDDYKNVSGHFFMHFLYDQKLSESYCQLNGENLNFDNNYFKQLIFKGKGYHQNWTIDRLSLDDFSLTADIQSKPNLWIIKNLGIQWTDKLLVGLEGIYRNGDDFLNTQIHLLDINFEKIKEWSFYKNFFDGFNLKGLLKAQGGLRFNWLQDFLKWKVEGDLNLSTMNFQCGLFKFKDVHNIDCHISSKEGVTLNHIETALVTSSKEEDNINLAVDKLGYSFKQNLLFLNDLKFKISPQGFESLKHFFKRREVLMGEEFLEFFNKIAIKDFLEGTMSFDKSGSYKALSLKLKDGTYFFQSIPHKIQQFKMEIDPFEFNLAFNYLFLDQFFKISILSRAPEFSKGETVVSLITKNDVSKENLLVSWDYQHSKGLILHKIIGQLPGLSVDLKDSKTDLTAYRWLGRVHINFNLLKHYLPSQFKEMISMIQLGKGFILDGEWVWNKSQNLSDPVNFKMNGLVLGKNCEVKGCVFNNLIGQCKIAPGELFLNDLKIEDRAFKLFAQQVTIQNDTILLPCLLINQLKPSLLNLQVKENTYPKTLIIPEIEVNSFKGRWTDRSSWAGKGQFSFTNYKKKNLSNIIFAIPNEILAHLGLDLSLFTPIRGTVLFEFVDEKILLRKFIDMYSEGRLSRFNLIDDEHSYIDYEGQLNIQLKLKQSSMLLKIGEMFNFNIKGYLTKPSYNILRHSSDHSKKFE